MPPQEPGKGADAAGVPARRAPHSPRTPVAGSWGSLLGGRGGTPARSLLPCRQFALRSREEEKCIESVNLKKHAASLRLLRQLISALLLITRAGLRAFIRSETQETVAVRITRT